MIWVLNVEQAGCNSFSLSRVHLGFVPNRYLGLFCTVGGNRFKAPRAVSANASGPCLPFPALAKSAPAPVAEQPRPGRAADLPLRGHADFSAVPNVDPVRWSHGFEPAERVRAIPIRAAALPAAGRNANACALDPVLQAVYGDSPPPPLSRVRSAPHSVALGSWGDLPFAPRHLASATNPAKPRGRFREARCSPESSKFAPDLSLDPQRQPRRLFGSFPGTIPSGPWHAAPAIAVLPTLSSKECH